MKLAITTRKKKYAKAHCVAATTECHGPTRYVHKNIAYCCNKTFVSVLPPLDKVELADLPVFTKLVKKHLT